MFPQLPGYPQGGIRPIGSPGGVGSCYAANGEMGQCATLRQCYPIVYSNEPGEEDQIANEGLAEFLKETSGPCETPVMPNYFFFKAGTFYKDACCRYLCRKPRFFSDAETRQHFICCTAQNPRPPIIRPVSRPTIRTTQRPGNYPRPPQTTKQPGPVGGGGARPTNPPADSPKVEGPSSCGNPKVVMGVSVPSSIAFAQNAVHSSNDFTCRFF